MLKFLDYAGLSRFWNGVKDKFALKSEAVKSITRSGATFTATKADGTTFTFTQKDSNTHRPIQMNGTEILGDNTTALNLKAGTNVGLSNSSGTVTIAAKAIKVTQSSVSSLPLTISNSAITTNMEVIHSVFSNPSAITSDLTWNTDTAGKITLSGTINGTTDITLYLMAV